MLLEWLLLSMVPTISDLVGLKDKTLSLQISIGITALFALILMLIPAIFLDEKKICTV